MLFCFYVQNLSVRFLPAIEILLNPGGVYVLIPKINLDAIPRIRKRNVHKCKWTHKTLKWQVFWCVNNWSLFGEWSLQQLDDIMYFLEWLKLRNRCQCVRKSQKHLNSLELLVSFHKEKPTPESLKLNLFWYLISFFGNFHSHGNLATYASFITARLGNN